MGLREIIVSGATDPVRNFALEGELLERREGDFVLLYINSPCVVIGRNQVAGAEANLEWCAAAGVPVLRRESGGGAVWHDGGNINWAFTGPAQGGLDDKAPIETMIVALRGMGIDARPGPRGEIVAGGTKIGGTASCVRRGRRLFHGTLLWDSDLDSMSRALAGDPTKRGRAVASTPSPVANLRAVTGSDATATQFMNTLANKLTINKT